MTTLAKPVREQLAERFSIARPEVTRDQASVDGTRKWLIKMNDGQEVEAVHIPESDRGALCVSSQVGCTLTCRFCHTGTQPLVRNLGPDEILTQILTARDALQEWPPVGTNPNNETSTLTNIVMMGMGEPLYNYDNVFKAVKIMMDGEGLSVSKRKITLSTAGVVPDGGGRTAGRGGGGGGGGGRANRWAAAAAAVPFRARAASAASSPSKLAGSSGRSPSGLLPKTSCQGTASSSAAERRFWFALEAGRAS